MTFTLTRDSVGCDLFSRSVAYDIVPVSATPGEDYVPTSGTAGFLWGAGSVNVNVTVNGDATAEPDETYVVAVPPGAGATRPVVSPNPFRDGVEISFALASGGLVRLEVYDLVGRRVRASPGTYFPAGPHLIVWDGRADDGSAQPSGVYSLRVSGPGIELARRVVRLN
jgi:hypothetical protein